jgi:cell division protein FtsW (lipid II flippase)
MLTDPRASSSRMLGSGLTLALLPSLLLALDDPLGDRGVLIALAGLVALAVGVGQRWAAPLAAGAIVTAVLAVRHLGPVADALPRWISLGSVGAVLLAGGVTWESRRRNLTAAGHYLAALR